MNEKIYLETIEELDECKNNDEILQIVLDLKMQNADLSKMVESLKQQLKNTIVPKFKIGQEVFYVVDKYSPVLSGEVLEIQIWDLKKDNIIYVIEYSGNVHCESVVFETLEEAEAKLEELKGEK